MNFLLLVASHPAPAAPAPGPSAVLPADNTPPEEALVEDLFDGAEVVCLFHRSESPEASGALLSGLQGGSETRLLVPSRLAWRSTGMAAIGKTLPRLSYNEVTESQADALRRIYGSLKASAKQLARDSGGSERSARNHLSGTYAFHLTEFFNVSRTNPDVRDWGCLMMGCETEEGLRKRLDDIEALIASARLMIEEKR